MLMIILGMSMLLQVCRAGEQVSLKDQKTKDSYSIGYEFGSNLMRQAVEVDVDVLLSAAREALEGKKPILSPEEIRDTLEQLRRKAIVLHDQRFRERAVKNLKEGRAFLDANKAKEGIQTLPSGLQYKVFKDGNGSSPKVTDTVKVNYRGTLINGTEFDSSYSRGEPETVHVNGVIPGWMEALQLMKAGSKWQIFVPSELAYGERQFSRIPPNSTLIFEIELLSIGDGSGPKIIEPQPATEEPAIKPPSVDGSQNPATGAVGQ